MPKFARKKPMRRKRKRVARKKPMRRKAPIYYTIDYRPKYIKLKYSDATTINAGVGSVATVVVRANGAQDPENAIGGGQPRGWNEYTQFFNHYMVRSASIKATFMQATSASGTGLVGIMLNDTSAYGGGSLITDYLEAHNNSYKYITYGAGGSRLIVPVYNSYNPSKFYSIKNPEDAINRLGAATSAVPSEQAYFIIYTTDTQAGDPPSLTLIWEVTYWIELSEPTDLVKS